MSLLPWRLYKRKEREIDKMFYVDLEVEGGFETHKVYDVKQVFAMVEFLIYDGEWKYIDSKLTKPHREVF